MPIDYDALATEIGTDPQGLGYSGNSDHQIAEILNTKGLSGETIEPQFVSADELQRAVVGAEYLTLTDVQRELWLAILTAAAAGERGVAVGDPDIRGQVLAIWTAGSTTRSNLAALQTRDASRGEILFGEGTQVTRLDVALSQGRT